MFYDNFDFKKAIKFFAFILMCIGAISVFTTITSTLFGNFEKDDSYMTVTLAEVKNVTEENAKDATRLVLFRMNRADAEHKVRYTFSVDGVVYGGSDVTSNNYQVGDFVSIKYNPEDPTENKLE